MFLPIVLLMCLPVDRSLASLCLPFHIRSEFKNHCFISIHKRVSELQTFVCNVVMKEFTNNISLVNLLEYRNMPREKTQRAN